MAKENGNMQLRNTKGWISNEPVVSQYGYCIRTYLKEEKNEPHYQAFNEISSKLHRRLNEP